MRTLILIALFFLPSCNQYRKLTKQDNSHSVTVRDDEGAPVSSETKKVKVDAYIQNGQSNGRGRTDVSLNSEGVYIQSGLLGPNVFFAREMYKRTGKPVYVVNCSLNGAPLSVLLPGQPHFDGCLENYREGAERMNLEPELKGILFYQGETDALSSGPNYDWANKFERYVQEVRRRFNNSNMPVVFAQLAIFDTLNGAYQYPPYWEHIKEEQEKADDQIFYSEMVKTDDITVLRDHVHPDDVSYERIGKRMAEAMSRYFCIDK